MEITMYPSAAVIAAAAERDDPLMAVIAFDGKTAIVAEMDEAVEHHILLMKAGFRGTEIDQYFRIIFDREGANWTFICPPDYKNIPYKDRRIERFYKDGFAAISEFLHQMGYLVGINIPKRYRRHLDVIMGDGTVM